jgi:uroporphyrinogen decarboxylase
MNGIELVKKAFAREEVDRIPWVPFVGCHGASILNMSAATYLSSTDSLIEGVSRAIDMYRPDGIPVIFDLQVEAEVLGCKLKWSDDSPPAVISHPLAEGVNIDDLKIPCVCKGRIPLIMEATRTLREQHPNVALYGLITGPFTLGLHLMGTDIFMKMFEDPEAVIQLMRFTSEMAKMMSQNYIEAGCDVVAMVDPMTSQIDPGTFKEFVSPRAREIFQHIRDHEALSSFFVCGHAQQNIEAMCDCKPDNISIDENIPLDYVKETALKHDVSFGGNMKLTTVLLLGTPEDAKREALECMDLGGKNGFILSPGCDLAMDTPFENLKAITEIVHDEWMQSELRATSATIHEVEKLDLTQHWRNDKVMVDIITLDSSSCAPCQYMVNAVERAARPFGDNVVFKEYRIKDREGVQMMISLGVKNLPTIVIDGNVEFISRIPPINKLEAKMQEYLKAKNGK